MWTLKLVEVTHTLLLLVVLALTAQGIITCQCHSPDDVTCEALLDVLRGG